MSAQKSVPKDAAPVVGSNNDTDQRPVRTGNRARARKRIRNPGQSAAERILKTVGNDVVVYRKPIYIGIAVIVAAGRHADKQGVFGAAVLMGMIDAGWNHHQIAIESSSEYFVNETMRGRVHSRIVKHNSDLTATDENTIVMQAVK